MGYKSYIPDIKRDFDRKGESIMRLVRGQIEGDAKRLCPVDTGTLKGSITGDNDDKSAVIGTNVEYAAPQEFGTNKMAANAFLEPAATQNAAAYARIAKEVLGR